MSMNAREVPNNNRVQQDPVDPGTYPGRLVQVIDFGLQAQEYNGESKAPAREIGTTYELVDEFLKDEEGKDIEDKPRWLSESFALHNLASDRAKSTARYYALDPDERHGGDWSKLLGSPVMVTVVVTPGKGKNKGKTFNNIASTSTMRAKEAEKCPKLINEPKVFDLSDTSKESLQMYHDFPQWIRDKIKKGLDFEGSAFDEALMHFTPAKKDTTKSAKKQEVAEVDDDIPTEDENW